ncbi:MAG: DUF2334 domain-containing protein [Nanoarchaeota archaeon]|nr:DUF2334 domain-containing protein [Nanoarchaeota archaeon]
MTHKLDQKLEATKKNFDTASTDKVYNRFAFLATLAMGVYGLYKAFQREVSYVFETKIPGISKESSASLAGNQFYSPDLEYLIKNDQATLVDSVMVISSGEEGVKEQERLALSEMIASYFGVKVYSIGLSEYQSQFKDKVGAIVYLGNEFNVKPSSNSSFAMDIASTKLPVFWMGYGVEEITEKMNIEFKGYSSSNKTTLNYKGIDIPIAFSEVAKVSLRKDSSAKVISPIYIDGSEKSAGIIEDNGLYYVAFNPVGIFANSFAQPAVLDVLSNIFGRHNANPRVLLRIEDLNGLTYQGEDQALASALNYLDQEDIPVHLGMIPSYIDDKDSLGIVKHSIWDSDTITAFLERHRTKVMAIQHGSYHHRTDQRNSGLNGSEATEFFVDDDEKMGTEESVKFAHDRLVAGYNVLAKGGVFPQAFEAPHYEMSPAQREFAESMYPMMFHPLAPGPKGSGLMLPMLTSHNATVYCPTDIGYISSSDKNSVDEMLKNADVLRRIMPDPIVTAMFHPFVAKDLLRAGDLDRLVTGLRDLGYSFEFIFDHVTPYMGVGARTGGYVIPGVSKLGIDGGGK